MDSAISEDQYFAATLDHSIGKTVQRNIKNMSPRTFEPGRHTAQADSDVPAAGR